MYNLCIFIFIIYAMSYSVSEILLKQKRHTVSVPKRKSHAVKSYKTKHEKSRNIKFANHARQTTNQIKLNNKKKTSYKKPKTRTGRKPVRVAFIDFILKYAKFLLLCVLLPVRECVLRPADNQFRVPAILQDREYDKAESQHVLLFSALK